MSTRNKAAILDRTLESIAGQVVPFACETIVVDDGSSDETAAVCRKYDVQYCYLNNPRHRNPSVARNVGYRAAKGDVIIAQSDDVIHVTPNAIERLVCGLRESGEFLIATVHNVRPRPGQAGRPVTEQSGWKIVQEYTGQNNQRPFFFLGSLWRRDLYAIGGNDEEFTEPCWDDNWFADCLMRGLNLSPRYTSDVVGFHQEHNNHNSSAGERRSKALYEQKVAAGVFMASGGPWEI